MQNTALKLVSANKSKRPTMADKIAAQEKVIKTLQAQKDDLTMQVDKLENPEQSEVIEAVKVAFQRRNRLAAFWGFIKGGWAPIASFDIVHSQLPKTTGNLNSALTVLVVGALLFSAPNVYEWCVAAFKSRAKALGFVVLIEGVMVFDQSVWLAYSALVLLIAINGIQSACNLAIRKKTFGY